jgi:hypothetical protein
MLVSVRDACRHDEKSRGGRVSIRISRTIEMGIIDRRGEGAGVLTFHGEGGGGGGRGDPYGGAMGGGGSTAAEEEEGGGG